MSRPLAVAYMVTTPTSRLAYMIRPGLSLPDGAVPLYTHPARGVVDEAMVERACAAAYGWWKYPENQSERPRLREQMRAALQAVALPAVGEGWRSVSNPPASKPHQWSEPVAALTVSGDVFRVSYMHGDAGSGVWQRLKAMADLGVGGTVVAWTPIPTSQQVDLLAAAPAQEAK